MPSYTEFTDKEGRVLRKHCMPRAVTGSGTGDQGLHGGLLRLCIVHKSVKVTISGAITASWETGKAFWKKSCLSGDTQDE